MNRQHLKAAALRLGFTSNGAEAAAQTTIDGLLADEWLRDAHEHLTKARDMLILANAPRSLDRVRHALKSVEGAQRHARLRPYREGRQQATREERGASC